jgi:hypothetical protein
MKRDDKILYGAAAVILGGLALKYASESSYNALMSSLRQLPVVGGLFGSAGQYVAAGSGIKIGVSILNPQSSARLSKVISQQVKAQFSNNTDAALNIYAGMSIMGPGGMIYDFPVRQATVNAHSVLDIGWWINTFPTTLIQLDFLPQLGDFTKWADGDYKVRASAWRVLPVNGQTPESDRIGDAGWIPFSIGWF